MTDVHPEIKGKIRNNIRKLRVAHGLSQADLARAIGKTKQQLWKYEFQWDQPKESVISLLMAIFKCHRKDILYHID